MKDLREKIVRGTADFPFARYDFALKKENFTVTPTQWHNELEIITIKKGKINLLLEGNSHILKSGDIAFVNPNEYHAVKILDIDTVYTAFVFSKELITFPKTHFFENQFTSKVFSRKIKIPNIIHKTHPLYKAVSSPVEKMRDLYTAADPEILPLLLECFNIFLKENALISVKKVENKIPDYVKTSLEYLENNYAESITLSKLCDNVHLSPNYFCTAFKAATGLTPIEQLQIIRIEKAETLLLETDLSLEEVAHKCGFQNVGYFIRLFKKQKMLTPYSFRKQMKI